MPDNEQIWAAVVRRAEPISGVAVQPQYHVGPMTGPQMQLFEDHFEENFGLAYYVDEVVELLSPNQLRELI